MGDEPLLLRAILADPADDTRRLAYADWLDENGGPAQAEFVRLQCRLHAASAADPDFPDLWERHRELAAGWRWWVRYASPPLPPGFDPVDDLDPDAGGYRGGFLHAARGAWGPFGPGDEDVDLVCRGLADLVATTTVRRLDLSGVTAPQLARVLAAPGADALTGLSVRPVAGYDPDEGDELAGVVAAAKGAAGLEHLELAFLVSAAGARALAAAPFARLEHLGLPILGCPGAAVRDLTRGWFRGLRRVRARGAADPDALAAGLAGLRRLDRLDVQLGPDPDPAAWARLRAFPALTALRTWGTGTAHAGLAAARFPRLARLDADGLEDEPFAALLAAPWFARLRALRAPRGWLGDPSVVALSASPAARTLRVLGLGGHRSGPAALAALADGARFPSLSTLELDLGGAGPGPADQVGFARRLALPRLTTLVLDGWRLGSRGAAALARNPALAGLTRLFLDDCRVGDPGVRALLASRHLRNVTELGLRSNRVRAAADALADPDVLPRLATCWLTGNDLPPESALRTDRRLRWVID